MIDTNINNNDKILCLCRIAVPALDTPIPKTKITANKLINNPITIASLSNLL